MPRWLIVVCAVSALAFWLVGAGLQLSGGSSHPPTQQELERTAEGWKKSVLNWFPQPTPLSAEDLEQPPECGVFPLLSVAPAHLCTLQVRKGRWHRGTKLALVAPQPLVEVRVKQLPPGREPYEQKLDPAGAKDGRFELTFGTDGGGISVRCLEPQRPCVLRFES